MVKRALDRSRARNRLTILNFHRVSSDDGSAYRPLDPGLFEECVRFCVRNFAVRTFAELDDHPPSDARPPVVISFDDGYKDFTDVVVPILKRHQVRANLNVIPACVKSGLPPLNVLMQDFIGKAPPSLLAELDLPGLGPVDPSASRERTGMRVSHFIKNKPISEQSQIREKLAGLFHRFDHFAPTPMMTLGDVRAVASEHELGAHSLEHANLPEETEDYVRSDAAGCAEFFDKEIGRPTSIYALPNGAGGEREIRILNEAGFRHVLFTGEGFSKPQASCHPRFSMAGSSKAEIRTRSTGLVRR